MLKGGKLTVTFNETRSNKFVIQGENIIDGMKIGSAEDWTPVDTGATKTINKVTDAEITLDGAAGKIAAGTQIYQIELAAGGTKEVVKGPDGWYEATAGGQKQTEKAGTEAVALTEDVAVESYAGSLDEAITEIAAAKDYLRSYATELGNNYSIIETRQNFTEALIDVLETGADNLVLADMNEESANYLALQTRQQLAINSLSLASQSAQSILSLF